MAQENSLLLLYPNLHALPTVLYTGLDKSVHTLTPHLFGITSILISCLCLNLKSDLFASGIPTKATYVSHLSHTCYMPHPLPSSHLIILIVCEGYKL
jgi:hypothetical protein